MATITFKVEGMHCSGCAATIQALLERSTGVRKAAVSFNGGEAQILYDPRTVTEAELAAAIERGGYRVMNQHRDQH